MSWGSRAGALVSALVLSAGMTPAIASAQAPEVMSPQVVHTGTAPTGYEVTFRFSDPTATRMRIKGEWAFSSEADSGFSPATAAGRLPSQWKPGDFPLQSPNTTDPNFPVFDMLKDAATGVWSFTTPLPSGWFSYRLYRDCNATAPGLAGCTALSDPLNPPWNTSGSIERSSQVYVPSDPAFGTIDYSWQARAPLARRGALASVSYPSPTSTSPIGSHDLVVYTPPGYDPNRATPYPMLVLTHGGGEHELDWSTQGVMAPIVDNLIAAGKVQPLIVVNTNANGLPGGNAGYAADLRNAVFPFMESNYNVTRSPNGRAFAGQSAGGGRANEMLFNNTTALGYVGVWSCCLFSPVPPVGDANYAKPDLKNLLGLHVAVGNQDPVRVPATVEMAGLTSAGVPFTSYFTNGGHEWFFWRQALRDFLTRVTFRATKTLVTAEAATGALSATVLPATAEPAAATGTVQFMAGSKPLGAPVPVVSGTARLVITDSAGASAISAVYSGDVLYNASTSAAVPYASTSAGGGVGGAVPATLSLTLGSSAAFGAFTPGADEEYTASTSANVISTAGDASLTVTDPGVLTNGSFALTEPLRVEFSKTSWTAPVTNDPVTVTFRQHIAATQPLRTGTYTKTLTFTLSTTTP
jgi:enterochelin esterase-like enzyme